MALKKQLELIYLVILQMWQIYFGYAPNYVAHPRFSYEIDG